MSKPKQRDDRDNPMLMALTALVVTMHEQGVMNALPYVKVIDDLAASAKNHGYVQSALELEIHRERILRRVATDATTHH